MKIEIYKKANDENIYCSYEKNKDVILNFENIKKIAKLFLDKKANDEDTSYEIDSSKELILYKNTIGDVIQSLLEDEELINLYKDNKEEK